MKQPCGIILAGGQGRRMGGVDKAFVTLGGKPLLGHVIDRLEPQVAALALNANGDAARFARFGLPVIGDTVAGFAGPLAGVLAGMDWAAAQGADHVVTVATDTPFFPPDLVPRLLLEAERAPVVLAADGDGVHGVFGLWDVALRDDLRAALGAGIRRLRDWADAQGAATARFPDTTPASFFNINTPDDLAQADTWL